MVLVSTDVSKKVDNLRTPSPVFFPVVLISCFELIQSGGNKSHDSN